VNLTLGDEMNKKIAVIIVNWNAGALLIRCLDALAKQTRPADKIIIVDNASSDDSLAQAQKQHPTVEVLQQGYNSGFAVANNAAMTVLKDFEWITLLNPDAFPEPEWIANLLQAAAENHEYSHFASRMLIANEPHLLDGVGDCYYSNGRMLRRGYRKPAQENFLQADAVFSACAGAAMYRSSVLSEVGGFDEDFFCYCEDVDLGFRLQLAGYRCLYVPNAIVHHVGSAISGLGSDFTFYYGHRNLVWTYFKNMPGWAFWRYLPAHIIINILFIMWFTYRGRGKVMLRAQFDAIKGLPKMLRKRRHIQANRKVPPSSILKLLSRQ
jgi:GT2 family glycosyltransferase